MADPVNIPIVTTADLKGTRAAAAGLKEVQGETAAVSQSSKETAKGVNALGESFEKGAGAGRVIGEVLRGNLLALGQLGPVIKAAGAAMLSNPLFTLGALAGTIILPALTKIVAGWDSVRDSAKESGTAMEEAAGRAEKLGQARLANLRDELTGAADDAKLLLERLTAAVTEAQKVDDAQRAVELARIQDDTTLTPAEKARQTGVVNLRYDARKASRALDPLELSVRAAQQRVDRTQVEEQEAAAQVPKTKKRLAEIEARDPAAIRAELAQASQREIDQRAANQRALKINGSVSAEDGLRLAETSQRVKDLTADLADAEINYATKKKAAQEAAARADEQMATANKAAVASVEALLAAEEALARERSTQEKLAPYQIELRKRETDRAVGTAGVAVLADVGSRQAPEIAAAFIKNGASPLVRKDSELIKLNKAVLDAAAAAQKDGTTPGEMAALVGAMEAFAKALRARKLSTAALDKRIAALEGQAKGIITD